MKINADIDNNSVRADRQVSEKFKLFNENESGYKVLFLGNSITVHERAPQIGWDHNWGMAASREANDYVHLVLRGLGERYGALAYGLKNTHPARTTANSSSLHSFNYLTARMFGADVQYVATSGWGVLYPRSISAVMDYTGITVSNSVEGAKQTALWDYDSWVPDVILFNIGGNDTVSSGFEQEPYQQEAVKMVENLHAHYPDAKMIWTHTGSNAGKLALPP